MSKMWPGMLISETGFLASSIIRFLVCGLKKRQMYGIFWCIVTASTVCFAFVRALRAHLVPAVHVFRSRA